jgi:DNA-binding NarL/FixJ family response regulator
LLVDDCVLLLQSLARCFVRSGCVVTATSSARGADALSGRFDCGIFDIVLGGDDGVLLAERLLSTEKVRSAVFYTGVADWAALRRASQLGPIVLKERSLEDLMHVVAAQVARRSMRADLRCEMI